LGSDDIDDDGMYANMNVLDIGTTAPVKQKIDTTADIKRFFSNPFTQTGSNKKRQQCLICEYDYFSLGINRVKI